MHVRLRSVGVAGEPEIDKAKKSNSFTKNEIKNNYKRYEGAMNAGSKKYKKIQLGYYKNGTEKNENKKDLKKWIQNFWKENFNGN